MGVVQSDPGAVAEAVRRIRRRKLPDPAVIGNAGSFFKNPVVPKQVAEALVSSNAGLPTYPADAPDRRKLSAAWMIEACGWRFRRWRFRAHWPRGRQCKVRRQRIARRVGTLLAHAPIARLRRSNGLLARLRRCRLRVRLLPAVRRRGLRIGLRSFSALGVAHAVLLERGWYTHASSPY